MAGGLTLAARQQAEKLRRMLRSGEPRVRFTPRQMRGPAMQALQRWCDAQGVGTSLGADGGWQFTAADLRRFEEALDALALRPLNADAASTRIGRLRQGAEEHKSLGEQPLAHRILCSQPIAHPSLPMRSPPARWALDVDWRRLDLTAFAGLLVVENADVFYACGSTDWPLPQGLERFLVVYRGHHGYAHGLKLLRAQWPAGSRQIYFGDTDPAGLRIGLDGRYTHLLLPEITAFRQAATSTHVPAAQVPAQQWLQTRALPAYPSDHPLNPYLHIVAAGRGLLQQAALQLPLTAISTRRPAS